MEFKIVISDLETGRSYQREIKGPEAMKLKNKKIGDEFEGGLVGLGGYRLEVTGGSDKGGFPMKKGMHRVEKRILMKEGIGYKAQKGKRKRKRVVGEFITENIVQINTKIVTKGEKGIEELLGMKKEEVKEGEKEKDREEKQGDKVEKGEKPKVKEKEKGGERKEGLKKPKTEKLSEAPRQEEKKAKESPKEVSKPEEKPKEKGGK